MNKIQGPGKILPLFVYLILAYVLSVGTYYVASIFNALNVFKEKGPDVPANYQLSPLWIIPVFLITALPFFLQLFSIFKKSK